MLEGVSEDWLTLRVVPSDATSLTVYNLIPEATYQFTVLSRNRNGDEQFSPPATAKTKGFPAVLFFTFSGSSTHELSNK